MENASDALIMAGIILIAIIILSLGVFLFIRFSDVSSTYQQKVQTTETTKFNANFTKYIGNNKITAQDIVSVINFAKENNIEGSNKVDIYVNSENLTNMNPTEIIDFLKANSNNNDDSNARPKYYKLKSTNAIEYNSQGLIKKVTFQET